MNVTYSPCAQPDLKSYLSINIEEYFFRNKSNENEDVNDFEETNVLGKSLERLIDSIKEDVFCLIEHPYTDKLFRDSYSRYFSTLNREYGRDCIRVSLFKEEIKPRPYESLLELPEETSFLGYFTIRPTFPASYARSFINPNAFSQPNFISCLTTASSLIEGVEYSTLGFPHASQDGIVHSCSETAIWSLMEYFGSKYDYYGTILPSAIHNILKKITFQRLIPSRGMAVHQIGYTLRKLGFGSVQYTRSKYEKEFDYIVNDYVESGIPIIAITQNKEKMRRHAFLIIGHTENINGDYIVDKNFDSIINFYEFSNKKIKDISFRVVDTLDFFDRKFVIMDDNRPPYMQAEINSIGEYYGINHDMAKDSSLAAIIVPLYPKIYLDAVEARNLFKTTIKNANYGWRYPNETKLISRILLTSSRSFKKVIRSYKNNRGLIALLLNQVMPKFVYICEISTPEHYNNKLCMGFMLFDTTSSKHDGFRNNLLAIIYPDIIYMNTEGVLVPKEMEITPIPLYINNLKKNTTFAS